MPDEIQIMVVITGRVQGVFFRAHTQNAANRLNLKGYVKNLANGCVEAIFKGDPAAVNQMLDWCHKGPGASKVEHVHIKEADKTLDFTNFEIRY
jgi:acylphosphatase